MKLTVKQLKCLISESLISEAEESTQLLACSAVEAESINRDLTETFDINVEVRAEEIYQRAVEAGVLEAVALDRDDAGWDPIDAADRALQTILIEFAEDGDEDDEALCDELFERVLAGLT